ncbi:MAG: D-glycero-alpha-D-manno-heptose-1,7-bisphosphate 7-phosphatase [Thermoleophilia bacterium]
MSARRAMFLAADGIVVHDGAPNPDPRRLQLVRGAGSGLRLLRDAGFSFHVISNQPGVARGLFDEEELAPLRTRFEELLADEGIVMAGFSYCPHDPRGVRRGYAIDCVCRTPRPGLLLRAAREHDLDIGHSWLIGDRLDDIEAGVRAGCRTVLLDGREREWRLSEARLPHHVALGMDEAALLVLEDDHVLDWRERAVAAPAR